METCRFEKNWVTLFSSKIYYFNEDVYKLFICVIKIVVSGNVLSLALFSVNYWVNI